MNLIFWEKDAPNSRFYLLPYACRVIRQALFFDGQPRLWASILCKNLRERKGL
jgi:hypothetical protein